MTDTFLTFNFFAEILGGFKIIHYICQRKHEIILEAIYNLE